MTYIGVNMKNLILLLTAAPLLFIANNAQAYRGEHKGPGIEKLVKELNLSDDQKQKLQAVRSKKQEKVKGIRKQMREKRESFRDSMLKNESESTLRTKHNEIQTIRRTLADLKFDTMMETMKILTAEQKKKFIEMRGKMRKGRKGMRHRGGDFDE